MSYTLEQKREAMKKGELWWRLPESPLEYSKNWTSVSIDLRGGFGAKTRYLDLTAAEYHIGPTPPRVLSELERELLEALKAVLPYLTDGEDAGDEATQLAPIARTAIQKAEAQQ